MLEHVRRWWSWRRHRCRHREWRRIDCPWVNYQCVGCGQHHDWTPECERAWERWKKGQPHESDREALLRYLRERSSA